MIYHLVLAWLAAWAALSCGLAIARQTRTRNPYWRAFWQMTGIGGVLMNVAVAIMLAFGPISTMEPVLRTGAGLAGLTLAIGAILSTRPSPQISGTGMIITIQSAIALLICLALI